MSCFYKYGQEQRIDKLCLLDVANENEFVGCNDNQKKNSVALRFNPVSNLMFFVFVTMFRKGSGL